MKDKEFLEWIYDRLAIRYEEDERSDYMYKFRAIIRATDENQITPNSDF